MAQSDGTDAFEGVDGSAPTGQAFVDSFPESSQCQSTTGDIDFYFRMVECPTGVTYMWFDRPLPPDYAEKMLAADERAEKSFAGNAYLCRVISGTATSYIRSSTAMESTPSELESLIQQAADSFKAEASLTGTECP